MSNPNQSTLNNKIGSAKNSANEAASSIINKLSNSLPDVDNPFDDAVYIYPANLMDTNQHSAIFIIHPYNARFINKGSRGARMRKSELSPIVMKLPDLNNQMNYSHNYKAEDLLYNAKQGFDASSGGFQPDNVLQGIGSGVMRESLRRLQQLPGGGSVRNALHGGARAETQLLYDSPNLREWQFSWKILPDSVEDEQAYIDIFRYLMWLSAPTYNDVSQTYPAIMDISYGAVDPKTSSFSGGDLNTVMLFKRCALISINSNFMPTGGMLSPSGMPSEIDITLNFKELTPLSRNAITEEVKGPKSLTPSTISTVQSVDLLD
jgi:hypothetical protein